jgi:hypothetical protein
MVKPFCVAAGLAMSAVVVAGQAPDHAREGVRHILLIADRPSHGPLQHEHNAGVWLLQRWLKTVPGVSVTASFDGWPQDAGALDSADAIFMFCTGGNRHYAFQDDRTAALKKAAARGAGLMFLHYCVEPPPDRGRQEMLDWIGGYFEIHHSVNPHWDANFSAIAEHPVARGVEPFTLRDEWYYNMRFTPEMRGVTPILTAVPGPDTLTRPDGPHSGNPDVRAKAGQPHTVMWAFERPDGGRGVGMTGGHFHLNFGNENFRKLVLNALLWIARVEVPRNGVEVTVAPEELREHLDPKPPRPRGQPE